jgi:hypothetical protein
VAGPEPLPLGLDLAVTNRTAYAEIQAARVSAAPPMVWVIPGISLGGAWVWSQHRLQPQGTLWLEPTVGRHGTPLPVVPYARLTGLQRDSRAWQAGLMIKILLGAQT